MVLIANIMIATVIAIVRVTRSTGESGGDGDSDGGSGGDLDGDGGEGDSVVTAETVMVMLMVTVVKDTVW